MNDWIGPCIKCTCYFHTPQADIYVENHATRLNMTSVCYPKSLQSRFGNGATDMPVKSHNNWTNCRGVRTSLVLTTRHLTWYWGSPLNCSVIYCSLKSRSRTHYLKPTMSNKNVNKTCPLSYACYAPLYGLIHSGLLHTNIFYTYTYISGA